MLKNDERIDQLYSQEIKIIQNPHVFSFSLDAVLLAQFAQVKKSYKTQIVDLCAGNGAVGLFMAHKTNGHFTEVELQPKLADMAKRSIDLNNLSTKFDVLQIDLADATKHLKKDTFDTVVCNPPYFKDLPTSQKNPNPYLAIARHEIKTNLRTVCKVISDLLKTGGKTFLVYRPDRLLTLLNCLQQFDLAPKKIQFIYPKADTDANIVLVEAIKSGNVEGLKVLPPITVYDDKGQYTQPLQEVLYGK